MARQSRTLHRTGLHHTNAEHPLPIHPVRYALRMAARAKRDDDVDPNKLKRETAGRYTTGDGRFTVEQGSGGWMIVDGEQTNELGLPLVRGPFGTLDEAREGLEAARSGEAPSSGLAARIAELKERGPEKEPAARSRRKRDARGAAKEEKHDASAPGPAPVDIREFRPRDADDLRGLWAEAGIDAADDDSATLKRLAERNPGLFLVAAQLKVVVGSALGAWDGRRGWIHHVVVASDHRRTDLATRLVREVEERLRELGAEKVDAVVRDDDPTAALFWEAAGYDRAPIRLFRRDLDG
jgi:ribosomal protein S18 acetylase RimI-like enzyme